MKNKCSSAGMFGIAPFSPGDHVRVVSARDVHIDRYHLTVGEVHIVDSIALSGDGWRFGLKGIDFLYKPDRFELITARPLSAQERREFVMEAFGYTDAELDEILAE